MTWVAVLWSPDVLMITRSVGASRRDQIPSWETLLSSVVIRPSRGKHRSRTYHGISESWTRMFLQIVVLQCTVTDSEGDTQTWWSCDHSDQRRHGMRVSRMSGVLLVMGMARVSANSPPRFLLDTNVGSEIVLRLTEGETENTSILRWDLGQIVTWIVSPECHVSRHAGWEIRNHDNFLEDLSPLHCGGYFTQIFILSLKSRMQCLKCQFPNQTLHITQLLTWK